MYYRRHQDYIKANRMSWSSVGRRVYPAGYYTDDRGVLKRFSYHSAASRTTHNRSSRRQLNNDLEAYSNLSQNQKIADYEMDW